MACALPVPLRLPAQPLLSLALQTGITTLLRPYVAASDIARTLTLYAMQPAVMRRLGALCVMALGTTLCALAVLVPAMWAAWVVTASANANYLYAATTALGVWQGIAVVLMLRAALLADKEALAPHKGDSLTD